jgi:surface antigen
MNKMKRFLFAFLLPFLAFSTPVYGISQQDARNKINQIDKQINEINRSLADNQNKAQDLQSEIAVINAQVQAVRLQIEASDYQIGLLTNQIGEVQVKIDKTQQELNVQNKIMGEYIKTMYMNGQISMAELLMKSESFSDFVDESEYLGSMQQKVKETADKIKSLKDTLDREKKKLEDDRKKTQDLRTGQEAQRQAIQAQENYKNQLLAQIQASSNNLNRRKSDLYSQKAALSAAFGENIFFGGSGYPYGNPPARSRIDTPDAYGYLIGECTSYAAWKRSTMGRPVPRNLGNARNWASIASGSTPSVGAVMVFPNLAPYGHVAIVERVNGNGTIYISEYNWTPFKYSERTVNPYNYGAVFIR